MEEHIARRILWSYGIDLKIDSNGEYYYNTYDLSSEETVEHYIELSVDDISSVVNVTQYEIDTQIEEGI